MCRQKGAPSATFDKTAMGTHPTEEDLDDSMQCWHHWSLPIGDQSKNIRHVNQERTRRATTAPCIRVYLASEEATSDRQLFLTFCELKQGLIDLTIASRCICGRSPLSIEGTWPWALPRQLRNLALMFGHSDSGLCLKKACQDYRHLQIISQHGALPLRHASNFILC